MGKKKPDFFPIFQNGEVLVRTINRAERKIVKSYLAYGVVKYQYVSGETDDKNIPIPGKFGSDIEVATQAELLTWRRGSLN